MKTATTLRMVVGGLVLLAAGAVVLAVVNGGAGLDPASPDAAWHLAGLLVISLMVTPLGVAIASRTGNRIGWLLIVIGMGLGLLLLLEQVAVGAYVTGTLSLPGALLAYLFSTSVAPALFWAPVIFLLLLFPDGHLPSRRWLPLASVTLITLTVMAAVGLLTPGPVGELGRQNPMGWPAGRQLLQLLGSIAWVVTFLCLLAAAAAPIVRYRKASGAMRQQMKWLALSGTLVVIGVVGVFVVQVALEDAPDVPGVAFGALIAIGLTSIPFTTTIAILRHRLYDIDRLISRTVAWAVLTGALITLYAVGVIGMSAVARSLGGSSDLAVAASTLVVAAAFQPLRRRIQSTVDRRFNRARYDAQRTVELFRQRLREQVDLEELTAELGSVVARTVAPAGVFVWVRGAGS